MVFSLAKSQTVNSRGHTEKAYDKTERTILFQVVILFLNEE